ncbi:MAG: YebC/PmpR family DNA-binding transcriptional regulator [Chitinophagales bacterium]|jgi:YebC/PmpR family DNA-binding regulatory protein|nr:YebC/PmpR family DNA-binding transcriptional regulator [Bacteroidota bacterium]MBP9221238.1 YebC/PmpR family DNA-binding transcriptional regulator [Chitinophagales bacterium]MBP9797442.1 YebC/PmpR family DNA-binding transcriptional regulator [Chitinophagales bacterium]
MGRAFEYRKEKKFKRWDAMAKNFTRIGREIAIAVKNGGASPDTNPKLRLAIQNAKSVSMPKDRVDAAIKRASSKEEGNFEEVVYEGIGAGGVALMVECATDNTTRTVANVRLLFSRGGGNLGTFGSVAYLFDRKGIFKIESSKINLDEVELDLIDAGAEDIYEEDGTVYLETSFNDFGTMQKKLDDLHIEITGAELLRIPHDKIKLNADNELLINNLIDKLMEDDDVVNVFHNMEETIE